MDKINYLNIFDYCIYLNTFMIVLIIKMSWRFLNYIYKIYDSWTNIKLEADAEKKAAEEKAEKEKIEKFM